MILENKKLIANVWPYYYNTLTIPLQNMTTPITVKCMAILLQYTDDSITKYDDSYYRFFSKLIHEIFLSICNQFVKPQLRPFLFLKNRSIFQCNSLNTILEPSWNLNQIISLNLPTLSPRKISKWTDEHRRSLLKSTSTNHHRTCINLIFTLENG